MNLSDGGGGVCFFVKSSINFSVRNDWIVADLENLCIDVRKLHSKPLIIVNWYWPPSSPVRLCSHLENFIGKLYLTKFDFLLLGDMNADMDTGADIYGLHRLINEPTRITDKSIVLSHWLDLYKFYREGVSVSDHSLVYAFRTFDLPKGHTLSLIGVLNTLNGPSFAWYFKPELGFPTFFKRPQWPFANFLAIADKKCTKSY